MGLWFGPLSQRIIALGLALLLLLLALQWVIMPLISHMAAARSDLAMLRERRAMLISAKSWPGVTPPPAAAAQWLLRGRVNELRRQLTASMQAQAQSHGITLSAITVDLPAGGARTGDAGPAETTAETAAGTAAETAGSTSGAQPVMITLAASGPHDAMLRWIAAMERGTPVMRAKTLRLQPIAGRDGTLSLNGVYQAMAVRL